jgi:5-methyltetrahydropteroyltriglutamate--homocysteine methyltransferase
MVALGSALRADGLLTFVRSLLNRSCEPAFFLTFSLPSAFLMYMKYRLLSSRESVVRAYKHHWMSIPSPAKSLQGCASSRVRKEDAQARRERAMQRSTGRILTTHTGSLPRPPSLRDSLYAQEQGTLADQAVFEAQVQQAVNAVVHQQVSCGLDIINDGEMSKIGYSSYVKDRLTSFEGVGGLNAAWDPAMLEFPEYMQRMFQATPFAVMRFPSCTGPISYTGTEQLKRDLANLKAAVQGIEPTDIFMTAPSPGVIAAFLGNEYYASHEAYLWALADAMKTEYDAIAQAGFLLQLDCPDLAWARATLAGAPFEGSDEQLRALHIEILNHATRDISPEHMRLHMCWGNYEGPHHYDTPLREVIALLLQARPAALVLTAANPRHEHEWQVFEEVKLPEDKLLILGVLDTTTNFIEHPELVAQRLVRVARVVGRERVIAGTDCGFATFAGYEGVDPRIAWAKLSALVEGARLASQQLW